MKAIGELVTPKKQPLLASKVKKITKDYEGKPLYVLENHTAYIEEELQ